MCVYMHTVVCGCGWACVGVGGRVWVWLSTCVGMHGAIRSSYRLSSTELPWWWRHSGRIKWNPLWKWACNMDTLWTLTRSPIAVAVLCMMEQTNNNADNENPPQLLVTWHKSWNTAYIRVHWHVLCITEQVIFGGVTCFDHKGFHQVQNIPAMLQPECN